MSGKKEQKTVQKSEPWGPLKPYLKDIFGQAQQAFEATPRTPFSGEFFADPTARGQTSLEDLFAAASGFAGGDEVRQLGLDTASGMYLSPESNPFLAETIDAAIRPVQERYQFDLIPQLEDAAIGGGAYGGARQDLAQQDLAESFTREAGDISSNIAFGNYSAERGRQMQAPALLNAANALDVAGPETALRAAAIEQGWDQDELNEAIAAYEQMIGAPWQGLMEFGQILGLGSPYGTQTGTTTQTTGGPGAILQGLLGAGGLAAQLATGGMFPGTALAGAISPFFGTQSAATPFY